MATKKSDDPTAGDPVDPAEDPVDPNAVKLRNDLRFGRNSTFADRAKARGGNRRIAQGAAEAK